MTITLNQKMLQNCQEELRIARDRIAFLEHRHRIDEAESNLSVKALLDEAAARLEATADDLQWWAWPEVFGSTSGPRGGIGGQTVTTFQVIGFEAEDGQRIKWCSGVWKPWDGEQRW